MVTSAILTITVNGDTNNYLIDIDGNGDANGHTSNTLTHRWYC